MNSIQEDLGSYHFDDASMSMSIDGDNNHLLPGKFIPSSMAYTQLDNRGGGTASVSMSTIAPPTTVMTPPPPAPPLPTTSPYTDPQMHSRKHHHGMMMMHHPSSVLSWRLHPSESLSDWTFVVTSNVNAGEASSPSNNDNGGGGGGGQDNINNVDDENDDSDDDDDDKSSSSSVSSIVSNLDQMTNQLKDNNNPSSTRKKNSASPTAKTYHVHQAVLGVGPRRSEFFANFFRNKRIERHAAQRRNSSTDNTSVASSLPPTDDDTTIHIEVKPSAADAFPLLLDFVYSPAGSPFTPTPASAVALRHLATVLGIRELFEVVTTFIKQSLSPSTSPLYITEAETYHHGKILSAAVKMCAKHFSGIKFSQLVVLSPSLFERVIRSCYLECDSEVLSTRVASYCRCRPGGQVDLNMLLRLTNRDVMPRVSPDESLYFLNLLKELGAMKGKKGEEMGEDGADFYDRCVKGSTKSVMHVVGLANSNATTGSDKSERRRDVNGAERRKKVILDTEYSNLSSDIKVDVLECLLRKSAARAVEKQKPLRMTPRYKKERQRQRRSSKENNKNGAHANDDISDLDDTYYKNADEETRECVSIQTSDNKSRRSKKTSRSSSHYHHHHHNNTRRPTSERRQLTTTPSPPQHHHKQAQTIDMERTQYEAAIQKYQKLLKEKEKQINSLKGELGRFHRVPNEYKFSDVVSEHTYKEKPVYSKLGDCVYGCDAPTSMPKLLCGDGKGGGGGDSSGYRQMGKDGWVIRDEEFNGESFDLAVMPVFYYK